MKGTLAWIIFGLATLTCLFWIGFGVRDDLREDDVFYNVIQERIDIASSSRDKLHIGVAGDWKHHNGILRGVELAAEDINASGGVLGRKIVLNAEDDMGTVDGALDVAQMFAARPEIAFVVGHTQLNLNFAVAQNYEFYGLFCIAPNTADSFSSKNGFSLMFENGMPPHQTGGAILKLAKENGWKRLGLLYAKSDYAMRQARRFESMANKHEINIPLSFGFEGRGSGIAVEMERWKREYELDAMILAVDEADILPLVSASRVIGLEYPIVVVNERPSSVDTQDLGLVFFLKQTEKTPAVSDLVTRYHSQNGHIPLTELLQGYDSLAILVQAIQKAGSCIPAEVAAYLKGAKVENSVSGTLRFDEHGAAIKRPMSFVTN